MFSQNLNINNVLELGYVLHVVNEEEANVLAGKPPSTSGQIARRQINDLMRLKASPNTKDDEYLLKVRSIILSLGRGITRRKEAYKQEIKNAEQFKIEALKQYNLNRTEIFWKTVATRAFLAGGIGIALMQTLLALFEIKLTANSNALNDAGLAPSVFVGLIFIGLTKVVTQKLDDFKLSNIYTHYDWLVHQAQLNYVTGKLNEYKRAENEVTKYWHEYTKKRVPKTINFSNVLQEDIDILENWFKEREKFNTGMVKKALNKAKEIVGSIKRKKVLTST